jgi:hypothetical protein
MELAQQQQQQQQQSQRTLEESKVFSAAVW